jgi:TolA-binding protein
MRASPFLSTVLVVGLIASSSLAVAQETRPGSAAATSSKVTGGVADEGAGPSASILLTRQSQRLDLLETDLRDMRGILETDLRNLKMQIQQLGNNASSGETATTAEIRDLRDQVERLADAVAMTSRRMERTLEMNSDMEFRLLRMEKRLQTLMNMGGDELANAAVQDDTIPAGESGDVSMTRDVDSGEITWQMSAAKLNEQMNANAGANTGADAGAQAGQATDLASAGTLPADSAAPAAGANDNAGVAAPVVGSPAAPAKPEVLPDASPEEQYNFALQRAMQNDLETAEAAFAEFRAINGDHPRQADALFWLGRIQFLREQFDLAAMTFSEFNSAYPDDARIVDTTMWIAEAVSRFAPADQACAIYASLPNLLESPPERFTERLAALSQSANCGG